MLSSIEQSILSSRLAKLGVKQSGDRAEGEQATPLEDRVNCETIHKKFNMTSCYLCKHGYSSNKKEERKKKRHRQSQPAEFDEEIDVDFMRAIHLSLLQHSTPANHRSRESSSSSSSASSNRDQTQPRQDMASAMTVFSTEDSASLQRAIELSLQDSAVGDISSSPDDDIKRAIRLSLQDSGLPPADSDSSGNTDRSSSQNQQPTLPADSDDEFVV